MKIYVKDSNLLEAEKLKQFKAVNSMSHKQGVRQLLSNSFFFTGIEAFTSEIILFRGLNSLYQIQLHQNTVKSQKHFYVIITGGWGHV